MRSGFVQKWTTGLVLPTMERKVNGQGEELDSKQGWLPQLSQRLSGNPAVRHMSTLGIQTRVMRGCSQTALSSDLQTVGFEMR